MAYTIPYHIMDRNQVGYQVRGHFLSALPFKLSRFLALTSMEHQADHLLKRLERAEQLIQ